MNAQRWVSSVLVAVVTCGCAPPSDAVEEALEKGSLAKSGPPVVRIDTVRKLQRHIGAEDTVLLLATESKDPGGTYVIPACASRDDEILDPDCGQMTLGSGSALIGELLPEMDGAVPTGAIARPGPLIDCSALTNLDSEWDEDDNNGWRLACLEMTDGVVWGVSIDNGAASPLGRAHRNGIVVRANDGETLIGRTHLMDVRRGVMTEYDTHVTVTETIVERAELAATFSLNADMSNESPPLAIDGGHLSMDVSSLLAKGIGAWSLINLWTVGGDGNTTVSTYQDVVVDSDSRRSMLWIANNGQDPSAATNSSLDVDVQRADLAAYEWGIRSLFAGPNLGDQGNQVSGRLDQVTLSGATGGARALAANLQDWQDSDMILDITNSAYDDQGTGDAGLVTYSCSGCTETRFQIEGTRAGFLDNNQNLDVSALSDANFTGESVD